MELLREREREKERERERESDKVNAAGSANANTINAAGVLPGTGLGIRDLGPLASHWAAPRQAQATLGCGGPNRRTKDDRAKAQRCACIGCDTARSALA